MKVKAFLLSLLLFNTTGIQAQTSKVNVTIDGPGVVDEYYIPSADGKKQVKLKAVPSKFLGNVTFDGWSGDATGTSEELTVDADKAQNIHATFTYHRPVKKYPLLNLKQSWADMGKPMYVEEPGLWESEASTTSRGYFYLPVDYNRDGYLDQVQFPMKGGMGTDNHRENVRFWLGKPDGSFEEDPKNDNRMLGTVYSIHMKYADFNNDGFPDFCSFSSGYDRGGSTGDYPVILMSGPNGVYHDLRFTQWQKCELAEDETVIQKTSFHGGTVGDFDNDGDIDALFWNADDGKGETSLYLENDGNGNFTEHKASEIIDLNSLIAILPEGATPLILDCEVSDLNNDGYNDLVLAGHDDFGSDYINPELGHGYLNTPIVLWGNSDGKYNSNNAAMLPYPRLGYGITYTSPLFYDLNGDGVKELLVAKTGDGKFNTVFFTGGYLQVCELVNGQYVEKTSQYIPVESQAFNTYLAEGRPFIENVDGTDYYCYGNSDANYAPGLGVGTVKVYAIRNGILEPVTASTTTRIPSFDEGFPIYVDGQPLTDYYFYNDGVNPVDTMAEHSWGDFGWDATTGNMWRINMHHRQNTHFGRTCIRWNRDGQDPKKEIEKQGMGFYFISEVNIEKLIKGGYCLELYIKNSDPNLSLLVNGITMDAKNTDEGKFTGKWQRMICPMIKVLHNSDGFSDFWITVDKGDLNNEFFIDDIRIRRIADLGIDDYDRAFINDYLDDSYKAKERTAQITSQEFKTMLKTMIEKYAPSKMDYFNSRISDVDIPLTRNIATGMAYYAVVCLGADTGNYSDNTEQPADFWDGCWEPEVIEVLPHANDEPTTPIGPDDNFWMEWQEIMQAVMWNHSHVSDFSGLRVLPIDKDTNSYHWLNPFTWEEAICAITRLYDSLDPGKKVVGDMNGDGVVNVADIVELINGDGEVNAEDIKAIVNNIMMK